jgi:predicted ABC-type ATPase
MVFAGPNGSGKTTVAHWSKLIGTYVNADCLKADYGLTDIEAAQNAEALRKTLIDKGEDFTFETVMSTERNLLLLEYAKRKGYDVQCVYVMTCNPDINVARVKARKSAGGHDVPEEKIRTRYQRALSLLPRLIGICDRILVIDNSDAPTLVFDKAGPCQKMLPSRNWPETALRELLNM